MLELNGKGITYFFNTRKFEKSGFGFRERKRKRKREERMSE